MPKSLRRTLLVLGLLTVTVGAALLYLVNADLAWTRELLADAASRALGHRLSISGQYHLHLGRVTHVAADDLLLANAAWATAPNLAAIGHLEVALETRSLLRGPIHVLRLEANGVAIHLERDGHGKANWRPGSGPAPPSRKTTAPLPWVDRMQLEDVHVDLRAPGRATPLVLELSAARAGVTRAGVMDLDLQGAVNGTALRLAGHAGPVGALLGREPMDQDLDFQLGSVTGHLEGRTTSLSTLAGASLDLKLHGPDLTELTALLGTVGVPGGAFDLEATTRPAGAAIDLRAKATTPVARGEVEGRVVPGSPPSLDLHLTASGKDLGTVAALAGIRGLPARPFTLDTSFQAHGFPVTVERLKLEAGTAVLAMDGTVGRPPSFDGTDASVKFRAPDTSLAARLVRAELPTGKVKLSGRLAIQEDTIRVTRLDARIGGNELRAHGEFAWRPERPGASFTMEASGPDLAAFDGLARTELPSGPFRATGKVSSVPGGIRLESIAIELGGDHLEATGTIRNTPDRAGSELQLSLAGRDPSPLASLAGLHGLPAKPFQGSGRLALTEEFLEIQKLRLRIGDNQVSGTVRLARPPAAGPIEIELLLKGPNASEIGSLVGLPGLSPSPYEASGEFEVSPEGYRLSNLKLRYGRIAASANGVLGRPPGFNGTSLTLRATGPRLSELGSTVRLPELPDLPFDIGGELRIDSESIELHGVQGTLGGSDISLDGAFRPRGLPLHLALDLGVRGGQPSDLTRFLQGLGVETVPQLPSRPYSLRGHLEIDPAGFRLDGLQFALGAIQGSADGYLGAPPAYRGTSLRLEASGGNRVNIEELTGEHVRVEGLRFHCSIRRLEGRSPGPAPLLAVEGDLAARRLALGSVHDAGPTAERSAGPDSAAGAGPRAEKTEPYLFSEEPFHFHPPTMAEGTIDCRIATLRLATATLRDAHIGIRLDQNGLHLDPVRAGLDEGGSVSGSLWLRPERSRLAMELDLRIAGARPGSLFGRPGPDDEPSLDAAMELRGRGISPHELVSGADGRFYLKLSQGNIESSILDSLGDSVFLRIIDALNPFRKKDTATNLECAVIAGTVEGGEVDLQPMGLTTDKVTTIAHGKIDLATEKISIDFASKARRGLGLSASTLTNQYIKIGGTLREPSVQIKPLSAAAKTGLAVVTAGVSLLAEGLWNRATSGSDVCRSMAEEVDEMWRKPPGATPKARPGR